MQTKCNVGWVIGDLKFNCTITYFSLHIRDGNNSGRKVVRSEKRRDFVMDTSLHGIRRHDDICDFVAN